MDRISDEIGTAWPACRRVSKAKVRTAFPPPCSTFPTLPSTISPWRAAGLSTRAETRSPLWLVPVPRPFINSTWSSMSWACTAVTRNRAKASTVKRDLICHLLGMPSM